MSAQQPSTEDWAIQFAYPEKSAIHWATVEVFVGSKRDAETRAVELYDKDQSAVDLLVVPAESVPV